MCWILQSADAGDAEDSKCMDKAMFLRSPSLQSVGMASGKVWLDSPGSGCNCGRRYTGKTRPAAMGSMTWQKYAQTRVNSNAL